jgi:hypothetical protein
MILSATPKLGRNSTATSSPPQTVTVRAKMDGIVFILGLLCASREADAYGSKEFSAVCDTKSKISTKRCLAMPRQA